MNSWRIDHEQSVVNRYIEQHRPHMEVPTEIPWGKFARTPACWAIFICHFAHNWGALSCSQSLDTETVSVVAFSPLGLPPRDCLCSAIDSFCWTNFMIIMTNHNRLIVDDHRWS